MKIRYTYARDGIIYYQRSVPQELAERVGSKTVKARIKATSPASIAREVEGLNRKHEAIWSHLREDPSASGEALAVHAEELLRNFGLSPKGEGSANDPIAVDLFSDYLDGRRYSHIDKTFGPLAEPAEIASVSADDFLTPVEREAAKLLTKTKKAHHSLRVQEVWCRPEYQPRISVVPLLPCH